MSTIKVSPPIFAVGDEMRVDGQRYTVTGIETTGAEQRVELMPAGDHVFVVNHPDATRTDAVALDELRKGERIMVRTDIDQGYPAYFIQHEDEGMLRVRSEFDGCDRIVDRSDILGSA